MKAFLNKTALIGWLLVLAGCASLPPTRPTEFVCPVTLSNGETPPGEKPDPGFFGNGQLWTGLWPDGKVIFSPDGPGEIGADGSLTMKWFWWRGTVGKLSIEGRRLDGDSPLLGSIIQDGYGELGFQSTALVFPAAGCWTVTGRAGDGELTFVVQVIVQDSQLEQ